MRVSLDERHSKFQNCLRITEANTFTVPSNMVSLHSLLLWVILQQCYHKAMATRAGSCRQITPVHKLLGHQCLANSSEVIVRSVTPERCRWECLRHPECTITSYHEVDNICILTQSPCNAISPAAAFTFTSFGPYSQLTKPNPDPGPGECLSWAPVSEFDASLSVHHPSDSGYVGRILFGSHALPGGYYTSPERFSSVLNNQEVTIADGQVEFMKLGCGDFWPYFEPYTVGNQLPSSTIVGGYKSDGTLLYVIIGGYYIPQEDKGYTATPTVSEVTEMEFVIHPGTGN